jgi:hypothetical protein
MASLLRTRPAGKLGADLLVAAEAVARLAAWLRVQAGEDGTPAAYRDAAAASSAAQCMGQALQTAAHALPPGVERDTCAAGIPDGLAPALPGPALTSQDAAALLCAVLAALADEAGRLERKRRAPHAVTLQVIRVLLLSAVRRLRDVARPSRPGPGSVR